MSDAPRPSNFLADIVEADLPPAGTAAAWSPAFRPSRTASCTSATRSRSSSTSASRRRTAAARTSASTTRTRSPRRPSTSRRSRPTCAGSAASGASTSTTRPTSSTRMYACAERLVREGKAYVDTQPQEAIREQRGSFERPGVNSPFRDRPPAESLDLLRRMKRGRAPGRRGGAARADRHGAPERAHARSAALPDPPRAATTGPATAGASTRCTTSRIRSRTRSRA